MTQVSNQKGHIEYWYTDELLVVYINYRHGHGVCRFVVWRLYDFSGKLFKTQEQK